MGLTTNGSWKCNKEVGTFIHALWDCSLMKPFWKVAQTTPARIPTIMPVGGYVSNVTRTC